MLAGAMSYHLKLINSNFIYIFSRRFLCASYALMTCNKIMIMGPDFFSSLSSSSVRMLRTKELMGKGNFFCFKQSLEYSINLKSGLCLYISTSVWVLRTPHARRNSHFQRFCCKKPKYSKKFAEICSKFLQKTGFF